MQDHALSFVLPAGSELVSGGNLYNRHLIAALGRRAPVRTLGVAEGLAAMRAGEPGRYFIDTLNLAEFLDCLQERRARQQRILVVHLLPSMRPDLDPADPAQARALAIERAALPCFDGFLTTSSYTREILRAAGMTQAIMTVRPAPPDAAGARARRSAPAVMRGLMVGNLVAGKGILPFLEALDARLAPGDRFALDLVGRTDMEPAYAGACRRAITPRLAGMVHVRGEVAYEDMGAWYGAASALVSASQMESFGMALQEARAWGLPILACDAGNVRNQFTPGENGYLHATIPDLADGFLALVRDPARMQRLFARAQETRPDSGYTWDEAARALLDELATLGPLDRPRA
jgi:glycosyltransferase involved in cell wall biosynthesis